MGDLIQNLGIDLKLIIAQLFNFFILLWILRKFLYKPLIATLNRRREQIERGIEDAQKAERDRMMAEENYNARMKEAEQDVNRIVATARAKEEEIVKTAEETARSQSDRIIAEGRAKLAKEHEDMRDALRRESAELVVLGVEKILREEVNREKSENIIRSLTESAR